MMNRYPALLAVITSVITALLLTLTAAPARAHAGLTSSNPEDGAVLDALPSEIVLSFTEEISTPAFVVVTDPDGTALQSGDPVVDGATVRQSIDSSTLDGRHTVAYRVVSADGHPVQGHVRVTVEGTEPPETTAASTPSASPAVRPDADDEAETERSFSSVVVGGLLLLVALLLGVLALVRRGRR